MAPKALFTQEVVQVILANIEQGCFPQQAALAAGVSRKTLMEWLHDPRPRFREFQALYEKATAKARVFAEKAVFTSDPKFWLRYGPGRERPDYVTGEMIPGWTEAVQKPPEVNTSGAVIEVIASPHFQAIQKVLNDVLKDQPEKRAQIASQLALIEGSKGQEGKL